MFHLAWRFLTLRLAALGLTMGAAHVLELPPKMHYDGLMYAAVNSTLYPLFGSVGGAIQVGSLVTAAVLAFRTRGLPAFRFTLAGTLCLLISLILWSTLVAPVNAEWSRALHSRPAAVAAAYLRLRDRWEYGHVAAFIAWLLGFCLLLLSVLTKSAGAERRT